ncbi:hypothetical protein THAOC_32028 [Thalassiosira oceanica]|uniref:Amine oxidase domain-containing protein n=1 Tax=Thalassiosira oceanica TaxID=159749 RepID=K0RJU5_THAOC|nr:hypothetical protein THAOC_32028 [Thalassiosira oceanica]|eukprot:EJK49126.1 hypothetical protein THAOC_32028 [Thalassiosira oceanica]
MTETEWSRLAVRALERMPTPNIRRSPRHSHASLSACGSFNSSSQDCPLTREAPSSHPLPFRVLVVGTGLTGCLVALRLRQRADELKRLRPIEIVVDVTERATYPSGQFGAVATHGGSVADVGAQVLSTLNVDDHRAMGGHGVEVKDIKLASEIVQRLLASSSSNEKLLVRAKDEALGETEERMIWEGLWQHYFAPYGMASVLRKLLEWANVEPSFLGLGLIPSVRKLLDERGLFELKEFIVEPADQNQKPRRNTAEATIRYLSSDQRHVLKSVKYDVRTCEAHFFSGEISDSLARAFSDESRVELMVEDIDNRIQYISWQDRKQKFPERHSDSNDTVALVIHGRAGELHPLGDALDRTLSKLSKGTFSPDEVSTHRIHSKSILWDVSQLITPMEAVVADPPSEPPWQCIVSRDGRLIVAGDFMTQSSFLGCVASADAAARAVVEAAIIQMEL